LDFFPAVPTPKECEFAVLAVEFLEITNFKNVILEELIAGHFFNG